MTITKFNPICGLQGDDFARDRRTVHIHYMLAGSDELRVYEYTFPMAVLDDIGAAELAKRIYYVFKTFRCKG